MKTKIMIILGILVIIGAWFIFQEKNQNSDLVIINETSIEQSQESTDSGETTKEQDKVRVVPDLVPEKEVTLVKRNPIRSICIGEGCDGSMSGDNSLMAVKIPLMKIDTENYTQSFFYAPHTTQKTSAVLDATYKVLFSLKPETELFADGITRDEISNPAGYITSLQYDSVTLQNGIAKVYLKGDLSSVDTATTGGGMTLSAAKKQIEQVAFQFDTVKKIEVYLNGGLNWSQNK